MPKIDARLTQYREKFDSADLEFLRRRKREIESDFKELTFPLGWGVVHGDAHTGNLMRDLIGQIHLIDYGDVCVGPREWDVCVLAVGYSVGTIDAHSYAEFSTAYGFDPFKWDGFDTIKAARELNMTTWLMQLVDQSPQVNDEINKRLYDLRDGRRRDWKPF